MKHAETQVGSQMRAAAVDLEKVFGATYKL
jgi:hypothetical protein